jgi:hypothetical protein
MRHFLGMLVVLVLAGIAFFVCRTMWLSQQRQRRSAKRGMRIRMPENPSERPTELKED